MHTQTPAPAAAASASTRIAALDILRGLALFGMILVHFHMTFRETTDLASFPGEQLVGWVVWLGVEQKAWATFAFLFGVGFAILMRRAKAKGQPLVALFLRRMAVLAAVGLAIQVFTGYYILAEYALCGVVVLLLRHRSPRALLVLAVVAAMTPWLIRLGLGLYEQSQLGIAGATAAWKARLAAESAAGPAPTAYIQAVTQRLQLIPAYLAGLRHNGASLALILLGLAAVKHGIFDDPKRHLTLIRRAMAFGLASWVTYWVLLPRMPMDFAAFRVVVQLRYGLGIVNDQWLALTYLGAAVLLLTWRPQWKARLASIGVAGRMAFTNYALQCIALEYISSPFGLHLKLRPYYYVFGAIALFTLQIALSKLWLESFRYGPLEWLWRSGTYGRWQPLRRHRDSEAQILITVAN